MVFRVVCIGDGRSCRGTPNADEAYAETKPEVGLHIHGGERITIGPEIGPPVTFVREDVSRLLGSSDSAEAGDGKVPCDGNRSVCCNEPTEPHTCPYAEEINEDYESLCNCCEKCEHECVMDI